MVVLQHPFRILQAWKALRKLSPHEVQHQGDCTVGIHLLAISKGHAKGSHRAFVTRHGCFGREYR